MRQTLILHPESTCLPLAAIRVDVSRPRPRKLVLHFIATGAMTEVRTPGKLMPLRARDLWKHTCFEAFVRIGSEASYYELNFAPSTQWAAYRFRDYRRGMKTALEICPARLSARTTDRSTQLWVGFNLPDRAGAETWHVGLSAVIEERNGTNSYWALTHPPGDPDFHHAACFALELPAATGL